MSRQSPIPWGMDFRAHLRAMHPGWFIYQYLRPLFFRSTTDEGKSRSTANSVSRTPCTSARAISPQKFGPSSGTP
jgi:hypothetical protein